MSALVAHRGPDDLGDLLLETSDNRVGLAHRRLSIVDLSANGRQPMTVDCPRCQCNRGTPAVEALWLTFNGEIYNHPELRHELEAQGHRFTSQTDSEVLLHLFAHHGPAMLSRLNGIFALAIYDGRKVDRAGSLERGDLFLARDGLGVKPLYYATPRGGFLFASELKALLASPNVDRSLDLEAIYQYLTYLWACAPSTPLRGVRKFEPGEAMIVRRGKIARAWRFYDLPYQEEQDQRCESQIIEELRERLAQAVERQMMADVPVGAFLSGGLDSSTVVALMRQPGTRCYTIGLGADREVEGNSPDLPYARRVAADLQAELRVIDVQANGVDQLENLLYSLDEPQADPAPLNALLIARQARSDGIKVLMSGAGGDDIFTGYRRHWALAAQQRMAWIPSWIRSGGAGFARRVEAGTGPPWLMSRPLPRRMVKFATTWHGTADERIVRFFRWGSDSLRRGLFSGEAAASLGRYDVAEPLLRTLERIPRQRDPLQRLLYLEAKHFLADHNLNYTDKVSMASGVEVRVPLLDLELVDFVVRIPSTMKQQGRVGKAIFKKAAQAWLPNEVIYRPKTGFGAPLRRWLRGELRGLVDDVLSPESLGRRGLFDPPAIRRLIDLDRAGRVDGGYTIFAVLCLELWLRTFVDRSFASHVAPTRSAA